MEIKKELAESEIIDKIMLKKEFSKLPRMDVKRVYSIFNKGDLLMEEKIKKTRDLLRKMYTAFVNNKLLNIKNKEAEWFLRKHVSSFERLSFYEKIYGECFVGMEKSCGVVDFGSGVNGFSYNYFKKVGFDIEYLGIEPVGQLVDLQNNYFERNGICNARCVQESLFNLDSIKKIILEVKFPRVAFFFKVLDSLEMLEKDYSKEVLIEVMPFFDLAIISWATASLKSKKKFYAKRDWIRKFIEQEFLIVKEFDCGFEHYLIFSKK